METIASRVDRPPRWCTAVSVYGGERPIRKALLVRLTDGFALSPTLQYRGGRFILFRLGRCFSPTVPFPFYFLLIFFLWADCLHV